MTAMHDRSGARKAFKARRGFLAKLAVTALTLPLLPWSRKARAQAVYYDQYGQPVTISPGATVTPAAPAGSCPGASLWRLRTGRGRGPNPRRGEANLTSHRASRRHP